MSSYSPKLPRKATDGSTVMDRYGNLWRYSSIDNAWISIGSLTTPADVSEENDGLVTADVFNKLRILANNTNPSLYTSLKLLPGIDAYWYYFRSSDKLLRFKPESENILRIELDQGRLHQILAKASKPGLRGDTGQKGPTGPDGRTVANPCDKQTSEPSYSPSMIDGNRLDFAIYTPTPLKPPSPVALPNDHIPTICIRVYNAYYPTTKSTTPQLKVMTDIAKSSYNVLDHLNKTKALLIQRDMGTKVQTAYNECGISLSDAINTVGVKYSEALITIDIDFITQTVSAVNSTVYPYLDVEKTIKSIIYDNETSVACGSIYLIEGYKWTGDFAIRSRQRGPDGIKGEAGYRQIKLKFETIDDTNLEATKPIVNVRFDATRNTLNIASGNLLDEPTVSKISLLAESGSLTSDNAMKSVFAAVQMIISEDKYIYRYLPKIIDETAEDLVLAQWEPLPGCVVKRHFDRHKFNWIPTTDEGKCQPDSTWYGANNTRESLYPWSVITSKAPTKDECCQEDFFYCPNIQDVPCPGETNSTKPTDSTLTASELQIVECRWNPAPPVYYTDGGGNRALAIYIGLKGSAMGINKDIIDIGNATIAEFRPSFGGFPATQFLLTIVPKYTTQISQITLYFAQGAFYNSTAVSPKFVKTLSAPRDPLTIQNKTGTTVSNNNSSSKPTTTIWNPQLINMTPPSNFYQPDPLFQMQVNKQLSGARDSDNSGICNASDVVTVVLNGYGLDITNANINLQRISMFDFGELLSYSKPRIIPPHDVEFSVCLNKSSTSSSLRVSLAEGALTINDPANKTSSKSAAIELECPVYTKGAGPTVPNYEFKELRLSIANNSVKWVTNGPNCQPDYNYVEVVITGSDPNTGRQLPNLLHDISRIWATDDLNDRYQVNTRDWTSSTFSICFPQLNNRGNNIGSIRLTMEDNAFYVTDGGNYSNYLTTFVIYKSGGVVRVQ